jgi:pyruvate/2-oxoglutarate dehydrogenase complex dihydrolipoamide dehydrogenase (E3) component
MSAQNYKNVVIGSGEGGKYLAWHLAQSEQPTVVVERRWVGGSCPNVNCLPSKNEIWSAKVADLMHHGTRFGITLGSAPSDMAAVRKRKREMVESLISVQLDRYRASGAELVLGEAKFTGSKTLEVRLNDGGTRILTGERIFLNLGTHASIPSAPGLAESQPLTNIELLELDRLPEHLIVLGGGYVGLEFAQAYRRFGSRVTILERGRQLLANQDPDVVAALLQTFASEGVDVIASAEILSVHGRSGTDVTVTTQTSSGEKRTAGSHILVATGRTPNTAGIGLEVAGVELDQKGYVKVNDQLQTTAPNIWSIGECAGSPQFTHISLDDF